MSYRFVRIPGAIYSTWGAPTAVDVDEIAAQIREETKRTGKPILYVTRVPVDAPPPDAAVRQHTSNVLRSLLPHCSTYHVVLEGVGFLSAVKRGVLTRLFQPVWRRKTFYVHAIPSEVLIAVDSATRPLAKDLLDAAKREGLLDCPSVP